MATNQQLYSLLYCTVNGALLTEHISVEIRRLTDAQVIKTVAKGFAGVSPGAPWCSVDVKNAVPSTDFELDPGPFMKALEAVEMGFQIASKQGVSKGFILEDSISGAVDSPSGLSFKFIGSYPDFR